MLGRYHERDAAERAVPCDFPSATMRSPEDDMTRTEKFTVTLFSVFAALVVLPGIVFSAIAIFSTGSIDLGPKP